MDEADKQLELTKGLAAKGIGFTTEYSRKYLECMWIEDALDDLRDARDSLKNSTMTYLMVAPLHSPASGYGKYVDRIEGLITDLTSAAKLTCSDIRGIKLND